MTEIYNSKCESKSPATASPNFILNSYVIQYVPMIMHAVGKLCLAFIEVFSSPILVKLWYNEHENKHNEAHRAWVPSNLQYKPQQIPKLLCFSSHLAVDFADRRCFNYIWVINNFISYQCATYIRGLTACVMGSTVRKIDFYISQLNSSPTLRFIRPQKNGLLLGLFNLRVE